MSQMISIGGYGTVQLSDAEIARLRRGESVTVNLWPVSPVGKDALDLYHGKRQEVGS